jgi:hypothetical protein
MKLIPGFTPKGEKKRKTSSLAPCQELHVGFRDGSRLGGLCRQTILISTSPLSQACQCIGNAFFGLFQ